MFGGGDFASDMASNGWRNASIEANNRANAWQREAEVWQKKSEAWEKEAEAMRNYLAENAAIRQSLTKQLAMVDVKNPILTDVALVQKLKETAVSVFRKNLNFEEVREIGRTFKIPGRENRSVAVTESKSGYPRIDDAQRIKHEYAGMLALRDALVRQLLIHDPSNPLLGDPMVQWKVRAAGQTAFVMNGEDFESARAAGKNFAIPERK